jgi:alpha-methylacyl-CoA racemase
MGPLAGFRIIEFAGIGPGPMAAMLFADLGASVLRLDRPTPSGLGIDMPRRFNLLTRNRPAIALDLKHLDGHALALDLMATADALIEGFRPGTMERLGLGPDVALARNPRLVYGRMTGWGQSGPLAQAAGHDLNYLALTGALDAIGRASAKPTPPLNLVGDYGGGALYLAFGIACAMAEAQRSGKGQVVDAAMTDGAASLMTTFYGLHAAGMHRLARGTNLLDSGSAIYDVYECADGRYVALAPIELKFRKVLFALLGLPYTEDDGEGLRKRLETLFKTRTRDEWCALLEGSDACFAPVLTMVEAPHHPHNVARGTFVEIDGVVQPAPAPRFSRTPAAQPAAPRVLGDGCRAALADWGIAGQRIDALFASGALGAEAQHE